MIQSCSAQEILARLGERLPSMTIEDYTAYIDRQLATWSLEELGILCRFLKCDVTRLDHKCARYKLGKG
jgi:hypothetical protein